jgi:hypothetical protein
MGHGAVYSKGRHDVALAPVPAGDVCKSTKPASASRHRKKPEPTGDTRRTTASAAYGFVVVGFAVCPLVRGIVWVDETGVTLAVET